MIESQRDEKKEEKKNIKNEKKKEERIESKSKTIQFHRNTVIKLNGANLL